MLWGDGSHKKWLCDLCVKCRVDENCGIFISVWVLLYHFHLVKNKTVTFYVHMFYGYGSSANTFSTTWIFFVRFLLSVIMESKNYSKNIFE